MNRLQIVRKYMSVDTKINDIKKYERAQKLSKKIIKKQDEEINKTKKVSLSLN